MEHFRMPEVGTSLSERLFKASPCQNTLQSVGFYISAFPRTAAQWIGHLIKEINLGTRNLESICLVTKTDKTAMQVLKRLGETLGKIGFFAIGCVAYTAYVCISIVDLVGIAIRAFGIPSAEPKEVVLKSSETPVAGEVNVHEPIKSEAPVRPTENLSVLNKVELLDNVPGESVTSLKTITA